VSLYQLKRLKKYGAIKSIHDTKEELHEAAYSLAETISSKERHSLVLAKKSLNSIEPIDIDAGFKGEQQISMNIDLD
jgi:enoyl-CoA hydratase/carnithine racemase